MWNAIPHRWGNPERGKLLVATKELLQRRFRLDVRTQSEVIRIDRATKSVVIRRLKDQSEYSLAYDKLILSPGASPSCRYEGTSSKGVFTLRSIADMDRICAAVNAGANQSKKAVVVGAGFIALKWWSSSSREAFRRRWRK